MGNSGSIDFLVAVHFPKRDLIKQNIKKNSNTVGNRWIIRYMELARQKVSYFSSIRSGYDILTSTMEQADAL